MELPGAHPMNDIADRITALEHRAFPDVMVYNPLHSVSGKWEAVAEKWTIIEADPVAFCAMLEERLRPVRPARADGR